MEDGYSNTDTNRNIYLGTIMRFRDGAVLLLVGATIMRPRPPPIDPAPLPFPGDTTYAVKSPMPPDLPTARHPKGLEILPLPGRVPAPGAWSFL